MTPQERADQVRDYWCLDANPDPEVVDEVLPPGSLILTPDEAETLRIGMTWAPWPHGREARLLLAGKRQT